jgi:excisionase family DNA binding protein
MTPTLLSGNIVMINASSRETAEGLTTRIGDRMVNQLELVLDDGSRLEVPRDIARIVSQVLTGMAHGSLSIRVTPDELTTTVAADMLGVSRPTLMKRIAAGELPAHRVGSHTRLRTSDVLAFGRRLSEQRRAAFSDLREWDEQFGIED